MMIVTKDTNIKMTHSGVEIHSYEDALAIGRKVLSAQKELDAILGSCLEYVKVHESHRYEEYLLALNIKKNRANVLIAHSRLVDRAEALNRSAPKEASKSQFLKGKTLEQKLDHYEQVQKETGKEDPTRSDIRNSYNSDYQDNPQKIDSEKRSSPDDKDIEGSENRSQNPSSDHREDRSDRSDQREDRSEKEIEIEAEPAIDYEALYKKTREKLKKEKALKEKYRKELEAYKAVGSIEKFEICAKIGTPHELRRLVRAKTEIDALHSAISDALDPLSDLMEELKTHTEDKEAKEKIMRRELSFKKMSGDVDRALKAFNLTDLSSLAELKKVHRELVKKVHPDKGGNVDDFTFVDYNYQTLKDFYNFRDNFKDSFGDN